MAETAIDRASRALDLVPYISTLILRTFMWHASGGFSDRSKNPRFTKTLGCSTQK